MGLRLVLQMLFFRSELADPRGRFESLRGLGRVFGKRGEERFSLRFMRGAIRFSGGFDKPFGAARREEDPLQDLQAFVLHGSVIQRAHPVPLSI